MGIQRPRRKRLLGRARLPRKPQSHKNTRGIGSARDFQRLRSELRMHVSGSCRSSAKRSPFRKTDRRIAYPPSAHTCQTRHVRSEKGRSVPHARHEGRRHTGTPRDCKKAASESIVLLKNNNHLLPLSDKPKHVLVIGPAAADLQVLLGNYYGLNPRLVTILEGLSQKAAEMPAVTLDYTLGCSMYAPNTNNGWTVGMAEGADVVIACLGLDNGLEGEEGESIASECKGARV